MTVTIDRLVWVPKKDIERLVPLMRELTIYAERGPNVEKMELYEERGNYIGFPRNFAKDRFKIDFDNTTFNKIEWPDLVFPPGFSYRPGQEESIEVITNKFQEGLNGALLEAHTGSGKTFIGIEIARRLETPVLITVHKNDLAEQWHETATKFFPGAEVGHVQQNKWDFLGKHIVTAMAQTLYSRRHDIPDEFWEHFGLTEFDEGHRYPARTFEQVMRLTPTRYRLGLSATWRRADQTQAIWKWHLGKIEHKLKAPRLTGEFVQISWNTDLTDKQFRWGGEINSGGYITAISKVNKYNEWISQIGYDAYTKERKLLIVSDRVDQLEVLRESLEDDGIDVGMYVGARKVNPRDKKTKKVSKADLNEAKTCSIICATYGMISEGTDIPDLDTLLLATPRREIEQVVGRIQRPHEDKKSLVVIDPVFQTEWNKKRGKARKRLLKKMGFKEQENKDE